VNIDSTPVRLSLRVDGAHQAVIAVGYVPAVIARMILLNDGAACVFSTGLHSFYSKKRV
jgi:hypothetical protein